MKQQRELQNQWGQSFALLHLLNSGLVKLLPDYSDEYDFLAISTTDSKKQFAVEIKVTTYRKNELKRVFSKERRKFSRLSLPTILMYIDQSKENGFYEVFRKDQKPARELQPLNIQELKKQISDLIS